MANEFILRNGFLSSANSEVTGSFTVTGDLSANKFIKDGGNGLQFLKADGTVDENTYLTAGDVPDLVTFAISSEDHAGPTTSTLRLSGSNSSEDNINLVGAGTTVITQSGNSTFTFTSNDAFDGTVTSVGISNGGGLLVSNSPITTSGTITITNDDRGSSQNIFKSVLITTGETADDLTITADSNPDTLRFQQEGSISVRTDSTSNTIIISGSDHTYTGSNGVVLVGSDFRHVDTSTVVDLTTTTNYYVDTLTFDTYGHVTGYGTSLVPDSKNTTYDISAVTSASGGIIRLNGHDDTSTDSVLLKSGPNVSVTYVDANTIEISSSDQHIGSVTSVSAGNGITLTGTSTINPTLSIVQHTPTAGSIGELHIGTNTLGVKLGTTSTTAAAGNDARLHSQNTDLGTSSNTFYLGTSGPKIKNNSGIFELRNSSDSDFADLVVDNLTVKGTTTTVESETVIIADNIITLNSNITVAPSENGGIEIERGTSTNASLIWNESTDKWYAGIVGSEKEIILSDHTHSSYDYSATALTGKTVFSDIEVVNGIVTGQVTTRELTLSDLGYSTPTIGDGSLLSVNGTGITVNWDSTYTANKTGNSTFTVTNTDRGSSQNIFKNITFTDTDSGHTWGQTGTIEAENNNDTITFVSGSIIDVTVSPGTDAIKINHGTIGSPSNSTNTGRTYIQSLGFDGYGHVNSISTGTESAVDTNTWVSGTGFNTTTGILTLHRSGNITSSLTEDLGIGSADTPTFTGLKIQDKSLYSFGENLDVDTGSPEVVLSTAVGTYTAAFYDYVVTNGSNSRAGTVISTWNGGSVTYTDNSTLDTNGGDTSQVTFSVELDSGNVNLVATTTSSNWIIKSIGRFL